MGDWQPTLRPGLATDPTTTHLESYALSSEKENRKGTILCLGVAQDDSGNDKPVAWQCDSSVVDCTLTGSWSITELPLPPGATHGAINDGTIDVNGIIHLVGSVQITGGSGVPATHAAFWQCNGTDNDCDLPASWTATDLGALSGLPNSEASGLKRIHNALIVTKRIVVGSSGDGGGNQVATIWEVDTSVTPPVVSVFDLNDLTPNLPANVTLTGALAITGRGTVATGKIETSPVGAAAGVSGPHAFFLATVEPDIPAVSEWGVVVMSLLVLAGGTLIMVRNRAATGRT